MEKQNSNFVSEGSTQPLTLLTSLATGSGEVALKSNPNVHQWKMARPSPSSIATPVSPAQLQFNSKQPVQVWNNNQSTPIKTIPTKKGFPTRSRLFKELFLIVFGMIICAIPLAVISTLYAQQVNSSTSTTTTTPTTTYVLPSQCTTYTTNNDSTRNVAYGPGSACDGSLTAGWYRFMGGAGNYLATTYVSRDTCNTYYGGSYNGSLPSTPGTTTYGILCLNNNGYLCYAAWSGSIIGVTNCNGYYVYYLTPITNCNSRYCTTN